MHLVSELDLPAFDYTAPDFSADRYHQQLAETRQPGWLAKSPLAYMVLDHDAGEFFLRSRKTAFPGRQMLRFEPVAPFTARICLDQVEYRDVIFPPGTIVAVCAERANRQGEDGESFDIAASRDTRLLTFGAGTHYCLGVNLARAELEEALAFLAPRTRGLALDGPPQLGGVEGIYGIDKLPVIWSGSSTMSPNHGLAPDVS
jgi:Cytochrome P450